jgi:hypothetical protein
VGFYSKCSVPEIGETTGSPGPRLESVFLEKTHSTQSNSNLTRVASLRVILADNARRAKIGASVGSPGPRLESDSSLSRLTRERFLNIILLSLLQANKGLRTDQVLGERRKDWRTV